MKEDSKMVGKEIPPKAKKAIAELKKETTSDISTGTLAKRFMEVWTLGSELPEDEKLEFCVSTLRQELARASEREHKAVEFMVLGVPPTRPERADVPILAVENGEVKEREIVFFNEDVVKVGRLQPLGTYKTELGFSSAEGDSRYFYHPMMEFDQKKISDQVPTSREGKIEMLDKRAPSINCRGVDKDSDSLSLSPVDESGYPRSYSLRKITAKVMRRMLFKDGRNGVMTLIDSSFSEEELKSREDDQGNTIYSGLSAFVHSNVFNNNKDVSYGSFYGVMRNGNKGLVLNVSFIKPLLGAKPSGKPSEGSVSEQKSGDVM